MRLTKLRPASEGQRRYRRRGGGLKCAAYDRTLASASLGLDARRLDNRPPLLDFGLLKSGKRLRRLLVAGKNLHPEVAKARAYRRVRQSTHHSRIKFRYDILRRA